MRELSLFSGAGGGLLGTHLLGWKPIGYVEWDDYCQRVIRQRIIDGILPDAPIFGDLRAFISSGCAELYRGVTDVITGGFPCQPFSVAGKQLGADDPRNMWPATIEAIRIIRPRYALLENVPNLIAKSYFGTILADLFEMGYVCCWGVISASKFTDQKDGKRLWIVVSASGEGLQGIYDARNQIYMQSIENFVPGHIRRATPRIFRRSDGLAYRVERTRAIGNGQVPAVAAAAWNLLSAG